LKKQNAASGILPDATCKIPSGRIPDGAIDFSKIKNKAIWGEDPSSIAADSDFCGLNKKGNIIYNLVSWIGTTIGDNE
jgi:hypothetical protein